MLTSTPIRLAQSSRSFHAASPFPVPRRVTAMPRLQPAPNNLRNNGPPRPFTTALSRARGAVGCRPHSSPLIGYAQAPAAWLRETAQQRRSDAVGCRRAFPPSLCRLGHVSARPHPSAWKAPATDRRPSLFYTSRLTSHRPVSVPRLP